MHAIGFRTQTFALGALLLCSAATAYAVPVTTCGQAVAKGQTGELAADLDCSSVSGVCLDVTAAASAVPCTDDADCAGVSIFASCVRVAVDLGLGAKLDLGGHALTGAGVRCADRGSCTVRNGEIRGAAAGVLGGAKIVADSLVVKDCGLGISSDRTVRVTGVTVQNCTSSGVQGAHGVRAVDSSALDNGGAGFSAGRGTVKGNDVVASGNWHGVDARTATVTGLTAHGNVDAGVITARNLTLIDSTVTGNGDGTGGPGPDVASQDGRIRLRNTACGYSWSPVHPGPHCALD